MLFLKSTTAPLAPGVYAVDIAAKPPGKTFSIYMATDADNPPQTLIEAIEGHGFKKMHATPYKHQTGVNVMDLHFHKIGTDIFEGWTEAERVANLQTIETLFTGYNIVVKPRVMTLAEAYR